MDENSLDTEHIEHDIYIYIIFLGGLWLTKVTACDHDFSWVHT